MRNILLIARRELAAYLRTMSGYVIIAAMLFLVGILFTTVVMIGPSKKSAEIVGEFFKYAAFFTMVVSVLLSMRLFAEERQTGTLALLYSSPVSDWEIVLGKFLAALGFLTVFHFTTLFMPALVMIYGKVSWGHLFAGYLGLTLLGACSLALGMLGSSLTKSQVLAAILGGVFVTLVVNTYFLARVTDRPLTQILEAMALYAPIFRFMEGVIRLKDIVFYGLVAYVLLFANTRVLEARRWR
jgi:ABC-2 type transport system permease protein